MGGGIFPLIFLNGFFLFFIFKGGGGGGGGFLGPVCAFTFEFFTGFFLPIVFVGAGGGGGGVFFIARFVVGFTLPKGFGGG
ncbi:MAG: hypothetical protein P8L20_06430, partial [Flavobacteriales bacterium]|nr:hypothetical protein [Flavobacteriales bacterium]